MSLEHFSERLRGAPSNATLTAFRRDYKVIAEHLERVDGILREDGVGSLRLVVDNSHASPTIGVVVRRASDGVEIIIEWTVFAREIHWGAENLQFPLIVQEGWPDHAARKQFVETLNSRVASFLREGGEPTR